MQLFSEDYLAHHGIQGQKWGVRRFQNPDGSLTEKGKKRVASLEGRLSSTNQKISKNQQKISKLKSYKKSRKHDKLEMKREKKEIKRAKLAKKVNEARKNRELYDIGPNRGQRKALKKAYKLDTAIAKIDKKQNAYKLKIDKLEYKNMKNDERSRRIQAEIDRLNSAGKRGR